MAMVKCKECGHEISSKAETCPQCGVKRKPKRKTSLVTWFVLVLVVVFVWKTSQVHEEKLEQQAKLAQEYTQNKDSILQNIRAQMKNGNYGQVVHAVERYKSSNDPELLKLGKKARIRDIEARLKTIPVAQSEKNYDLYTELLSLDPTNKRYKDKVAYYSGKLDQEKKRKQLVENYNYQAETLIKKKMHNPDSFEEVKTQYVDNEHGILIYKTYRGTNAFGAIVTNTAKIRFMPKSNTYEWLN